MRFLTNYAKSCDLRSIMRNRNIAEYQKPCIEILLCLNDLDIDHVKSNIFDVALELRDMFGEETD